MELFGVGGPEVVVIAVLAVILFGERLPEVARTAAKFIRQWRQIVAELQNSFKLDE